MAIDTKEIDTNTAIATRNVSLQVNEVEGLEGIDSRDVIMPRRTIHQLTSRREGGTPGHFFDNLTGQYKPSIEAVVIRVQKVRTLWTGNLQDTKPECAAYDGIRGSNTDGHHGGMECVCATCQFNPDANPDLWQVDTRDHKRCGPGYMFLCWDYSDGGFFILTATGKSTRPAKALYSVFANLRKSPFSALVKFETSRVVDNKGTYYVLKGTVARWFDDATEIGIFREMYQGMKGVQVKDIDPDESTSNGEGVPF